MRRVKTGIVGLGGLGKIHGFHLAHEIPQADLTAACSLVDEELEYAKDVLSVKHTFRSYEDMIAQADIEAVVIVSPSRFHAEHIVAALSAGKHVFSEKPLGVTVEECKSIEKMVEQKPDLVFTLGFMRRYDKSNVYAKKRIDAGDIGTPYMVKATTIDPARDVQACIKFARNNPGMLFLGLGVHDADLLRWFMADKASTVYAVGGTYAHPQFSEFGDAEVGCAVYTFEHGGMGFQHVGRSAPHGYHVETEIIGTEGTIRISPVPQKNLAVLLDKNGAAMECVQNYKERFKEAYKDELSDFCDCILERRKPEITVYDGTIATQMTMAATRAFDEKMEVQISY